MRGSDLWFNHWRTIKAVAQEKIPDKCTAAERKTFIRSFVKEVKVTGDEVLLTYTIPMLPRRVTEEKLPVLPIVHLGKLTKIAKSNGPLWTRTTDPGLIRTVL